jgi:superfamily II DNA/RNA helicase
MTGVNTAATNHFLCAIRVHIAGRERVRLEWVDSSYSGNRALAAPGSADCGGFQSYVPTVSHVFNFGLPMKAQDYTHRIGRTGRAGRDGIAVTFAEFRDRRKIFDIESYSRQQFKAEVIPGPEPQQRFPDSRPRSNFGGRDSDRGGRDAHSRDRKFGPARGVDRGGFGDKNTRGPINAGAGSYQNNSSGGFGQGDDRRDGTRDGIGYERRGGFNDRFAGRNEGAAPRGDFAARKPAFGKPMSVKPGNGGKVFVSRDAQKRSAKLSKPARD